MSSAVLRPALVGLAASLLLAGKTIVVTGTLKNYSRESINEAIQLVKAGEAGRILVTMG